MILITGNNDLAITLLLLLGDKAVAADSHAVLSRDWSRLHETINALGPDIIINCHEYPFPDESEYWRGEAYDTNAFFPKKLALVCRDRNALLVHISSSWIFGGDSDRPYREDDPPSPESFYGDSKLLGEKFIMESGCRHLIIRTADSFSDLVNMRANRIFVRRGSAFVCVRGQQVSPVFNTEAAAAVHALLLTEKTGIYHVTQGSALLASDFAALLLNTCAAALPETAEAGFTVQAVDKTEFEMPADRPLCNALDNTKFVAHTGIVLPSLVRSVERAVKENPSFYLEQFNITE